MQYKGYVSKNVAGVLLSDITPLNQKARIVLTVRAFFVVYGFRIEPI